MTLEFTNKQFRRLLDLVYIGNWILNSTRGDQRFADYDEVESLVFGKAPGQRYARPGRGVRGGDRPLPRLCRGRHPRGHHGV